MTDKEKLDAIRAEIHRLVDVRGYDRGMANDLFTFMDSLPNEPVSNDLEKEFYDFLDTLTGKDNGHLSENELFRIAEYFYELGLKAQKGE